MATLQSFDRIRPRRDASCAVFRRILPPTGAVIAGPGLGIASGDVGSKLFRSGRSTRAVID